MFYLAYRGCYSKSSLSDQTPTASAKSMSPGACAQVCKAVSSGAGSKFSGVEGPNCFCFDTLHDASPLTNRHCRTKCLSDSSQICGGQGAMSVTNLFDRSIAEVMVNYGGFDDQTFEIVYKDGQTCESNIPSPPTKLELASWTQRKDRYFIMCGGCDDCSSAMCLPGSNVISCDRKLKFRN